MRFLILIITIILIPFIAMSSIQDSLFSNANQLYKEKNYEGAITLYDSIAKSGFSSAALFFNLANAHFKIGHLSPAILNYERAKKLAPSDEDIEFNLKLANLRVVDRVGPVPELFFVKWAKNLIIGHSSDGWAKMALIMMWVTFGLGSLFLFVDNELVKRITFFTALVVWVLSLTSATLAYSQYNYQRISRDAILFSKNAYVKSAPDPQSTDLFILREGVKVKLLESEGEWQKIQLADGKVGWMRKDGLEVI